MSQYVEFRDRLYENKSLRNLVVPVEKLFEKVDPYNDAYRGMFYYDEGILKHIAEKGSVSGYHGKLSAPYIIWDFDDSDPELSRKDTIQLIHRLIDQYDIDEEEIGVFFSGRKGFHVEVSTKGVTGLDGILDENMPHFIKRIALKIGEGLETLDKGIYNANRLYRISGTLHNKESEVDGKNLKLFKTSITPLFLLENDMESIKKYSVEIRTPIPFRVIKNTAKISKLASEVITQVKDKVKSVVDLPVLNNEGISDENKAPLRSKVCQWRIQQGDYTEGRNNALLRAAVHEKELGKPKEVVKYTLLGILEMMNNRDPKKAQVDPITEGEIDTIVKQAFHNDFSFGCNDDILNDLCSRKCYLAPAKFKESKIEMVSMLEAYEQSIGFFKNYYNNIVPTGLNTLDERVPLFLGTTNLIVAPPGSGKTSLILNIINNVSQLDMPTLFFSLDMSQQMVIQRAAPIFLTSVLNGPVISGKEFMQSFARNDESLMLKAKEAFKRVAENVKISSDRAMAVKDIEDQIDRQEKIWGTKIKLVIIDYVQLLKSEKEGYHNDTFNAEALTSLAKNKNICIIGLSQTSRSSYSNNNEHFNAKGSGAWEEQFSTQINLFRPFKDTDHADYDHFVSLRFMKNRMGKTEKIDLYFNGATGIIRDLSFDEIGQLQALRQEFETKDD